MSNLNKTKLLLDLGIFSALLIVSAPRFTGQAVHEWLGIALGGAILVHLLLNWNWIVRITARLFSGAARGQHFKYVLNWSLFASGILVVLSGLMISKTVVPFFDLSLPRNMSWRQLHGFSTDIVMILMGLHAAVHWTWIVNMFKRLSAPRVVSPGVPTPVLSMQRKDARS